MKRLSLITVVVLSLLACGCNRKNITDTTPTKKTEETQLNITILLDLSDRIIRNPDAKINDIGNIKTITEFFKSNMVSLGAYKAKGKIKVFLYPLPADADINSTVNNLKLDCSNMDNKGRKVVHDTITELYEQNLKEIYEQTIATGTWQNGSDIWGFFKDGVHRCIDERNTNYRNILIVFTNGYLWANGRNDLDLTNTTSIQPRYLTRWHRNPNNWERERNSIKIKTIREDLQDLEILVLGIKADNPQHLIDEDILIYLWEKWVKEMGVKEGNYKILRFDLPSTLETDIKNFLNKK